MITKYPCSLVPRMGTEVRMDTPRRQGSNASWISWCGIPPSTFATPTVVRSERSRHWGHGTGVNPSFSFFAQLLPENHLGFPMSRRKEIFTVMAMRSGNGKESKNTSSISGLPVDVLFIVFRFLTRDANRVWMWNATSLEKKMVIFVSRMEAEVNVTTFRKFLSWFFILLKIWIQTY